MTIINQLGQVNTAGLIVPGVVVQIVPPSAQQLNGVASNIVGVVGTATWGPVNQAVVVGNYGQYAQQFGPIQARAYDLGTPIMVGIQQGASFFKGVRVTDGTDVAASYTVASALITYTGAHTGTLGNSIQVQHSAATIPGSGNNLKVTVSCPGQNTEIFDNIVVASSTSIWATVVAAINNGIGNQPASKIVVASSAGTATTQPAFATYTLTGGTDGVTSVTATTLVGTDGTGSSRTGMYALRGQNASIGMLADAVTMTTFSTQLAFGLQEGVYMIGAGPSGDTISTEITNFQASGVQSGTNAGSYGFKMLFGDWVYWADPVNNVTRLVSPQGFCAGLLGNLAPNESTCNRQIFGVVGTQKTNQLTSSQVQAYSNADLATLFAARIDVMCSPSPGGPYFAFGLGGNTSLNGGTNGDNYTTMTNFIAKTLLAGMGIYVGVSAITSSTTTAIQATLSTFLLNLQNQGILSPLSSGANCFNVVCSAPGTGNNPSGTVALGICNATVQVQYQAILLFLVLNLQGGQGVNVTINTTVANAT